MPVGKRCVRSYIRALAGEKVVTVVLLKKKKKC